MSSGIIWIMTTNQIKYRLEAPYKTEMAMKEKSYLREYSINGWIKL